MDTESLPTGGNPRVSAPPPAVEAPPPAVSGRRRAVCDPADDIFDVGDPTFTIFPMLGEAISQPLSVFADGSWVRGWYPGA